MSEDKFIEIFKVIFVLCFLSIILLTTVFIWWDFGVLLYSKILGTQLMVLLLLLSGIITKD